MDQKLCGWYQILNVKRNICHQLHSRFTMIPLPWIEKYANYNQNELAKWLTETKHHNNIKENQIQKSNVARITFAKVKVFMSWYNKTKLIKSIFSSDRDKIPNNIVHYGKTEIKDTSRYSFHHYLSKGHEISRKGH